MTDLYDVSNSKALLEQSLRDFYNRREDVLLTQLGELVRAGLLVIVERQPVLTVVERASGKEFQIQTAIRLERRDQQVMEELRAERDLLRTQLHKIKTAVEGLT